MDASYPVGRYRDVRECSLPVVRELRLDARRADLVRASRRHRDARWVYDERHEEAIARAAVPTERAGTRAWGPGGVGRHMPRSALPPAPQRTRRQRDPRLA